MKYFSLILSAAFFLLLFLLPVGGAQASEASVTITTPADNAVLASTDSVILEYEITPGPKGNHAHLMLDGGMVTLLKELKGTYDMGKLATGKHTIALEVMTASHSPIGVNGKVTVTVK